MSLVDRTHAYTYRGDRWTAPQFRGVRCFAVRALTPRKGAALCIRGKNGNMLVETEAGTRLVVLGRQLRKLST